MCNTDSTAHHLFFLVSFLGQGLQGHKCKPKKKKILLGLPMAAGGGGGYRPHSWVWALSLPACLNRCCMLWGGCGALLWVTVPAVRLPLSSGGAASLGMLQEMQGAQRNFFCCPLTPAVHQECHQTDTALTTSEFHEPHPEKKKKRGEWHFLPITEG